MVAKAADKFQTMNLINNYIISSILKMFCLALLAVIGIFIAIDYLGTMDEFIKADISLWRALQYVLLKIPFICVQLMPIILLMAILIAFGIMSRNNELMILNASGISIYALLKPVLQVTVLFGLILVYLSEAVVPVTMVKANAIKHQEIRKDSNVTVKDRNIWIKSSRQITHIAYFDRASKAIFGFTRYFFDDAFNLVRRIDAEKGEFVKGRWVLTNCMEQVLNPSQRAPQVTPHKRITEDLRLNPEEFGQIIRQSEEMSFHELLQYVRKVEREEYDATTYRVDLYAKSAYPLIGIIMGLIGVGLTARRQLTKGLPISIAYGIGIAFLYWVFQSVCLSLGYGEILPPVVAAWTANFVFLCGGGLLLLNAE